MRPIKFRCYDSSLPVIRMWYWEPGEQNFNLAENLLNPKVIVMQFTGLLDKNEKEIYEGDIIQSDDGLRLWSVEYSIELGGRYIGKGIGKTWFSENPAWNVLEVIGNIYENPELVKSCMTFLDRLAELEMKLSPQKIVNPYEVGMVIEACRRMYEALEKIKHSASKPTAKGHICDFGQMSQSCYDIAQRLLTELDGEAEKSE